MEKDLEYYQEHFKDTNVDLRPLFDPYNAEIPFDERFQFLPPEGYDLIKVARYFSICHTSAEIA